MSSKMVQTIIDKYLKKSCCKTVNATIDIETMYCEAQRIGNQEMVKKSVKVTWDSCCKKRIKK
jgi:hypothetical protein